jgi:hypothetical protein
LEGLQVRAGPVAEHLAGQDRAEVEAYRGRVDERHTPVELGGSLSERRPRASGQCRIGLGRVVRDGPEEEATALPAQRTRAARAKGEASMAEEAGKEGLGV